MLENRFYKPAEEELLYHYCSADTLLAICSRRTLRFCDLYSMNDFMEMQWGYSIWEAAASQTLDKVGKEFLDDIDSIIHESGAKGLALASCLSTSGDVLSQWRAYAQDGNGYAIGFKAKQLIKLAVRPLRVSYIVEEQIKEIRSLILALHQVEEAAETKRGENFFNVCAALSFDIAAFKNPAFSEEKEVRLIHAVNFKKSNNSLRIVDAGGTAFGVPVEPQPISFHMSHDSPVVHMDIDFSNNRQEHAIAEVLLGPKNETLPSAISVFLETLDIPNVSVKKSKASYR